MTRCAMLLLVMLQACPALWAEPGAVQATHPAVTSQPAIPTLPHISLDVAGRRVTVDAYVCLRKGALEFLLCRKGTKEHESILATEARASNLHAALLALGLECGKPAGPSCPSGDGPMQPPRGAGVKITLTWRDADGGEHVASPSGWIAARQDDKGRSLDGWVFVGSDILPGGRYWADAEGGIIAVSNFAFAVIDVPFLSTSDNEYLEFEAATAAIPPLGQAVQVIIEPREGAAAVPDARATVEIDRFGRVLADGVPIAPVDLADWAERYIARHAEGRVVVRIDGEAMVWHLDRTIRQLRIGGVRDIIEQRLPLPAEPLPLTVEQTRDAVAAFRQRLAERGEYVQDPVERGQAELQRVERRVAELEALRRILADYAIGLRAVMDESLASTQPAGQGGGQ